MSWQILILAQVLLAAFSVIPTRQLAKEQQTKNAAFAVNAVTYIFLYALGLAMLPFTGHIDTSIFSEYWWRLLGGGLLFALTNVFNYSMFRYLDAAFGSILATVNVLFTIVASSLVLHENLSARQAVGAVILILAISYAMAATRAGRNHLSRSTLIKASAYAVAAGVCFAFAIVNEKSLLGQVSVGSYIAFGWGAQALMAVLTALIIQPRAFKLLWEKRIIGLTAANGFSRSLAGLCFMLAQIRSNNVALVTVISNFRLIIIVLFGALILKERQKMPQKIVASLLAAGALGFMFWK